MREIHRVAERNATQDLRDLRSSLVPSTTMGQLRPSRAQSIQIASP
jgi:hypothetical protein